MAHNIQGLDPEPATTSSDQVLDWPTRVPGDPSRWVEGGESSEVCPVHEYLLEDGYCDMCKATVLPEKSIR